jgi:hypothetical protein
VNLISLVFSGNQLTTASLPNGSSYEVAYDPYNDMMAIFGAQLNGYSTIMYYDCANNYWRLIDNLTTSGAQCKNVGFSLKQRAFVLAYYPSPPQGDGQTGIALYKINPDSLPPIAETAVESITSSEMAVALSVLTSPFNPSTKIVFQVPGNNTRLPVDISIWNMAGQKVVALVSGSYASGRHVVGWDASSLSSGIYTIQMKCNGKRLIKRATLVK